MATLRGSGFVAQLVRAVTASRISRFFGFIEAVVSGLADFLHTVADRKETGNGEDSEDWID